MGVDLRPIVTDSYPSRGQILDSPGDPNNGVYDCTLECLRDTEFDYFGDWPFNDAQLRQDVIARYGDLGLLWPQVLTVAQDLLPRLAALATIAPPGNEAATIRAAISQGFMCHIALWCDPGAHVPPAGWPSRANISYSHCCRVVADIVIPGVGPGFALQNPEPFPDFQLSDADLDALADGQGVLIFQRSLLPAVPAAVLDFVQQQTSLL